MTSPSPSFQDGYEHAVGGGDNEAEYWPPDRDEAIQWRSGWHKGRKDREINEQELDGHFRTPRRP